MSWISIKDQLPNLHQCVLFTCFYDEDGGWWQEVDLGQYQGNKTAGDAIAIEVGVDNWSPCTHWMPLPQPPEISK